MHGSSGIEKLRWSPWRLNLHKKLGREGNGIWCPGTAKRKQKKK
jgi:hypothetical protein